MKTIYIALGLVLLLAAAALSGCTLDVIATGSAAAFESVLLKIPGGAVPEEDGFSIGAPDGGSRFILRSDWSGDMDALMEVDAAPFVAAGLDGGRLPGGFALEDGKLIIGKDLGDGALPGATPLELYRALVEKRPDELGYHASLDHFGIALGGGMFEWAKDMAKNDKDIVFVIDPAPLAEAGLQPDAVEGWVLGQVPTMDKYGAKITVERLLKPFDLG